MTWTTPDGQRAVKILADAGMLDDVDGLNALFRVAKSVLLEPLRHRINACILRDAARRYLEGNVVAFGWNPKLGYFYASNDAQGIPVGHGFGSDTDAALIAAVLAVEGDMA